MSDTEELTLWENIRDRVFYSILYVDDRCVCCKCYIE